MRGYGTAGRDRDQQEMERDGFDMQSFANAHKGTAPAGKAGAWMWIDLRRRSLAV